MAVIVDWPGSSGRKYRYWSIDAGDQLKVDAGNYVFAKQLQNGTFVPLYFGQGDNLRTRLPGHERLSDAIRAGATHVMAHTTPAGQRARLLEERDLIRRWQPTLNVQHRLAS